jgi:hypothetical protein
MRRPDHSLIQHDRTARPREIGMRSGRSAWALVAGNRTTVTLLLLTSAWAPAAIC